MSRQSNAVTFLKYDALNKSVRKALQICNITVERPPKTSRKWGAQLAEDGGAPEEDIMRQGRWCTKVMETVYLSKFPLKALRSLAGFPKKKGSYYLPRDMEVPQELIENIFPCIDAALSHIPLPVESQSTDAEYAVRLTSPTPIAPRVTRVVEHSSNSWTGFAQY